MDLIDFDRVILRKTCGAEWGELDSGVKREGSTHYRQIRSEDGNGLRGEAQTIHVLSVQSYSEDGVNRRRRCRALT